MTTEQTQLCRNAKGEGCQQVLPLDMFYQKRTTLRSGEQRTYTEKLCKKCKDARRDKGERKRKRDARNVERCILYFRRNPELVMRHGKQWLESNPFFRIQPTECQRQFCKVAM